MDQAAAVRFRNPILVDAGLVARIEQELHTLAGRGDVIVDLHGVRALSSRMLSALLKVHAAARRGGNRLILCCLHGELARIFDIARLDAALAICGSRAEAVALLSGPAP